MERKLGIVGASSVGVSVLSNIVRHASSSVSSVTVFDPRPPGCGFVFNPEDPLLLCNTSAGISSLFADDPQDFIDYLACRGQPTDAGAYLPRDLVGEYVRTRYEEYADRAAAQGIKVTYEPAVVNSIRCREDRRYEVRLDDGLPQKLDQVVIGVGAGGVKLADGFAPHMGNPRLITSPYPATLLRQRIPRPRSHVLVLGAGLSAIDAAMLLCREGHRVTLASRSGILPAVRNRTLPPPKTVPSLARMAKLDPDAPMLEAELTRIVVEAVRTIAPLPLRHQLSSAQDPVQRLREETELVAAGQCHWQDIVLPLIEQLDIWTADLPMTTRTSLLAPYRPVMWRYITSMAIQNARRLLQYLDDGLLALGAYDPGSVIADSTGFDVPIRNRGRQRFDVAVSSVGFHLPKLHVDAQTLYLRNAPPTATLLDHLNRDLRVRLSPTAPPEEIWLVGQTTHIRTPFANFVLQAVIQARDVARQLAAR